ncbi:TetR/AcrR family transcriptional regulator [Myceligenerans salitolerans]|uniref:TetR/AcrR family transcriptional regulator n=1 Tax=Myceligenerans salitolerans TaxID=1230528 RepID=A0ABS3I630_9MICO|nr:TetR/AcrR family transcriptional regulator [Myceligenerans salitolerans]MBO0608460.1 TetR/AcrR family transcriptional regulator [Myceligenerans salitolerans]
MPATIDTRQKILDAAQAVIAHKGWAVVGINEVLGVAGVPKGSFYHWFSSKDAFGEAMMQSYFTEYLAEMDEIFARPKVSAAARLMAYWENWRATQGLEDCRGKCLAVKLGAEVADLSEPMRLALKDGTTAIIGRVERMIVAGTADGSLSVVGDAHVVAQTLYDLWLGASVLAKIHRDPAPMDGALALTRQVLHLA